MGLLGSDLFRCVVYASVTVRLLTLGVLRVKSAYVPGSRVLLARNHGRLGGFCSVVVLFARVRSRCCVLTLGLVPSME